MHTCRRLSKLASAPHGQDAATKKNTRDQACCWLWFHVPTGSVSAFMFIKAHMLYRSSQPICNKYLPPRSVFLPKQLQLNGDANTRRQLLSSKSTKVHTKISECPNFFTLDKESLVALHASNHFLSPSPQMSSGSYLQMVMLT